MVKKVGRVFTHGDFNPLENARIKFVSEDGTFSTHTDTDNDGTYEVELPEGRYRTLVSHPEFVHNDSFQSGFIVIRSGPQRVSNFFLHNRTDSRWTHVDNTRTISNNDLHLGDFFDKPRLPLVGDFDGDGLDELAFTRNRRSSSGNDFWCIKANTGLASWSYLGQNSSRANMAFDASSINHAADFGLVGDFDGDGQDEIALKIDSGNSTGNDFWALKYNTRTSDWKHMSQIGGHPAHADFDCSGLDFPARFAVSGDFDGDGRDEIAIGIDNSNSSGNDLWVMEYQPNRRRWQHFSRISGHPMGADLDCSGSNDEARFAVAGDFDGDGIDELAVSIKSVNSRGNDFWVMKYDLNANRWVHLSPISNHPARADMDCGPADEFASMAVAADFNNDGRDELVIAARRIFSKTNDLWAMQFDPISKSWSHMSRIQGHPVGADIDPSTESINVESLSAADIDGDGVPELVITPEASGSRSNDLWVFKYDHVNDKWNHLTETSESSNASVDMSTSAKEAGFVVSGYFEAGARDRRAEIVASIEDNSSIALTNPNFWVMRYAPSVRTTTTGSGRLRLITVSDNEDIGTVESEINDITLGLVFDSAIRTVRVTEFPTQSDTFDTPFGQNTTTVRFASSSEGEFDPSTGSIQNLRLQFNVSHSLPVSGSTLNLTLSTFGRLPERHGGDEGEHINLASGSAIVVGDGGYIGGFLGGDDALVVADIRLSTLPS